MLSKRMQELAVQKAKLIELENAIIAERDAQLRNLHEELGYATRDELINALCAVEKLAPAKRGCKKRAAAAAAPASAPAAGGKKRRKRTKITAELRKSIEDAAKSGATGAAIAKQYGVSLPTVQNIKRAAGLTRGSS